MTAEATEVNKTSNLRAACEAFLREQSKRISPTPRADPGSYYRGYDNGMSDILYGLREVLARTPVETKSATGPDGFTLDGLIANAERSGIIAHAEVKAVLGALRELRARRAGPICCAQGAETDGEWHDIECARRNLKANLPTSVSMEGQPMGDPHPCDLTRAGCDPVTGKPVKAAGPPDPWMCDCGTFNHTETCCKNCGWVRPPNGKSRETESHT